MEYRFLSPDDINSETEREIKTLFSELTNSQPLSLTEVFASKQPPHIVICVENQTIIGMATMAVYDAISGRKAWIEDVIVSPSHRKRGIGEHLTLHLLEKAKELNASAVLLYSNPKREAAHRLYKRLGFTEKGSTLFIHTLY